MEAVYVFGGLLSGGYYTGTFTNTIQRMHLPTGAETIVGHLPTPLAHAMGSMIGGRLLVTGGSTISAERPLDTITIVRLNRAS